MLVRRRGLIRRGGSLSSVRLPHGTGLGVDPPAVPHDRRWAPCITAVRPIRTRVVLRHCDTSLRSGTA